MTQRKHSQPLKLTRAIGLATALTATPLWAAELVVDISDKTSQRPLGETLITITSRDNQQWQIQTNEQGRARIEALDPGLYEVTVSRVGYIGARLPSVRLVDDKATPVSLTLATSTKQVEEIVVVGNSIGGDWLSSAGASTRDREALRSSAGSGSDVLRALDGMPGLFSDGEFSSYTVRGSGPRDNLILVDGVPFERVVHFSDSFGELADAQDGGRYSVFAPNTVAQADFQPGGWSSAYGGRAGSLLQLDVANGNPETPSYTARLDIAGLEIGYDGPSRVLDNTSVLFSARQLNFGRLFETVGLDDIGEPEVTDVIFKTHTEFANGDEFNVLAIYAPESFSRDTDNVLASDEDDPGNYEDVELVEQESDNTLLVATYRKLLGQSAQLTNKIYYRHFSEDSQVGEAYPEQVALDSSASDVPRRFPIITARQDDTEFGWRLDFSYDNSLGRFSAGTRLSQSDLTLERFIDGPWNRYEYDTDSFRPNPEQQYVVLTGAGVDTNFSADALQYAAYFDQELSLGIFDVRAGLRYEGDEFTEQSGVSPRLALSWPLSDSASVSATLGRYLQMPRLDDFASNTNSTTLDYEIIDQVSLGLNYQLSEQWALFVEPYYQQLNDLVVQTDAVTQSYNNLGEGTSWGVDTAITRQFGNGWSASVAYSYNEAALKDSPNSAEYDADYSRPHSFSVGGVWEINQRWKLSGRWKWASGRPYGEYIVHDNVLGDGQPLRYSRETLTNNTERFDDYGSINVRLDYRRMLGGTQVIAFIDIINLLGEENPSDIDFNERTGEVLTEEGNLLPLIGLRFEW
ncbi:TonB-dependent receptor [Gilvimarinus sp. SDUM040013]|uniref:TonB-dependent receptor n=1 Tax=Gilvimarinus gilvus TaxID=3058038 RepID=A0ABU4S2T2_9GAMM|nr:TonB-dependent receptor [Gilvimarinus sp. SDUM040013]MDO3384392.1 TonB-dependent receptor [Gilvimarinus sp. SDUM040013]MDX6851443.1 TonB-dependent receptor [Gilvimarinus sp. SDUM040013]